MMKWIVGLALVIIAGAGLWFSGLLKPYLPGATALLQQATTTPQVQQQQAQQPVSDLPTASDDDSDAAIMQDSAAVDTQMKSLGSDQTNVDSSLNDQPTQQEF
ncbi:MAG TPA: hypothetical protein VG934_00620 [Candidatus Paceibacterota bacterium]|nr:hypothetical protein [Candidatus Paceibacterota bacterium]